MEQCVIGGDLPTKNPVLNIIDLVQKWPDIVGDLVAEKAFPCRVKNGTLILQTVSTVWANELQLLVPRLLDEIEEQCPQLNVNKIRFVA